MSPRSLHASERHLPSLQVDRYLYRLRLSDDVLLDVTARFQAEMGKGLARDTSPTAAVKMLPSLVHSLPDGSGESLPSPAASARRAAASTADSTAGTRAARGSGSLPEKAHVHTEPGEHWQRRYVFVWIQMFEFLFILQLYKL